MRLRSSRDKAYSPSVSSLLKFHRVKPRVVERPRTLQCNENQWGSFVAPSDEGTRRIVKEDIDVWRKTLRGKKGCGHVTRRRHFVFYLVDEMQGVTTTGKQL